MEEYLRKLKKKDFSKAKPEEIGYLQKVLDVFGYTGKKGEKIEITGELDDNTKYALGEIKKDFKLFQKIDAKYKIYSAKEYNEFINKANKFSYSEGKRTEFEKITEEKGLDINYGFTVTGSNWNKIFFIEKDRDFTKTTPVGIGSNGETLARIERHKIEFSSKEYDTEVFENVIKGSNIRFSITSKHVCTNFFRPTENLWGFDFLFVPYSDDPKILRMYQFDKVAISTSVALPEKKKELEEAKKPEAAIEIKTPKPSACDDLKTDWHNFVAFVHDLEKDGTSPSNKEGTGDIDKIREKVTEYNKKHPDSPITSKTIIDGKKTTYKYRMTPCRE